MERQSSYYDREDDRRDYYDGEGDRRDSYTREGGRRDLYDRDYHDRSEGMRSRYDRDDRGRAESDRMPEREVRNRAPGDARRGREGSEEGKVPFFKRFSPLVMILGGIAILLIVLVFIAKVTGTKDQKKETGSTSSANQVQPGMVMAVNAGSLMDLQQAAGTIEAETKSTMVEAAAEKKPETAEAAEETKPAAAEAEKKPEIVETAEETKPAAAEAEAETKPATVEASIAEIEQVVPEKEEESPKITGWDQSEGKWYYYEEDGTRHTGWLQQKGKWYYMDEDGAMVTGEVAVGPTTYHFDESGAAILE